MTCGSESFLKRIEIITKRVDYKYKNHKTAIIKPVETVIEERQQGYIEWKTTKIIFEAKTKLEDPEIPGRRRYIRQWGKETWSEVNQHTQEQEIMEIKYERKN